MGTDMDSLTTDADHRDRWMTTFLTHFKFKFKFKPFRDHGQIRELLPVIEAVR